MLAPPRPPTPDQLEALIREARARQRKRWLGLVAGVALLAGAALGIYSVATGTSLSSSVVTKGGTVASKSGNHCGIRVVGTRILNAAGALVYRDPSKAAMGHDVQCSGPTVWVIFVNGVGMMHDEEVGVRSPDRGRTWRVAFPQSPGVHAQYEIDEVGAWTLDGPRGAYFVSSCPACSVGSVFGTVFLSVTKDGGRTFRWYKVPALTGYGPAGIRVSGNSVTITGRRVARKVDSPPFEIYAHKTVTLRVA